MERLNSYDITERIGRGSYGTVYKALSLETGITVAIKVVEVEA